MDKKALLISAVATLAGMGLLRLYMQRFEDEVRGGPSTRVLMLLKDAPAGSALSRDMLGVRELPQAYLESRHVPARDLDQVIDGRLGVAGRANEALLITDLASMRQPLRQLSGLVPDGMRAFTLSQASGALEALLAPGDRVDVLLVPGGQVRSDDERLSTTLVAQNLLVLAVGEDLGGPEAAKSGRRTHSGSVTLSVTLQQSKDLAQAEAQGSLRLVLRNPDDISVSNEPGSVGRSGANDSLATRKEP
jgi:Flp pilus assembly protein CpaB